MALLQAVSRTWKAALTRLGVKARLRFILLALTLGAIGILLVIMSNYGPNGIVWSQDYVEERWGTQPKNFELYMIKFEWDRTGRYYASRQEGADGDVIIIDRINKRTCNLGLFTAFFDGRFSGNGYSLGASNQYGWQTWTTLDLSTWEITSTVAGACYQWSSCVIIDPPEQKSHGFCEPDKTYGPYGLEL